MSSFYEKTVKSQSIFSGRVITVQVDEVELPNGKRSTRELVIHPGAVAVMPFTADGSLVLVRQFRKPLEKEIYEIPAGKLEKGEDPSSCALRELEEETGFTAEKLHLVTSFYTSPGFADELIYIYAAEGLRRGERQPDEDEFVEVHQVSLDEALTLWEQELIHDAKTVFALMYWQKKHLEEQLAVKQGDQGGT